ncbi:MAG: coenzyme F420-0:L-glutamate ligase [Gammaproteobacteria bacterium]|nr:coenzyme F420-0:L-glutamate ligase [Gammaproteobacteria bacterium]
MPGTIAITPIRGIKLVEPGDDLASLLLEGLAASGLDLEGGDIVAVAQKIVSKAEGRQVDLATVEASADACRLAAETDKDPRLVQLILDESTEVVRKKPGVLIVRHRLGLVGAHAGVDQSNVDHGAGASALLLPEDPDASARQIRAALAKATGHRIGVLITDSANRPWRLGTVGIAIGAAGIGVLDDQRGGNDLYGRELKVTLINCADSLASAATLAMGETTERTPAALIRGFDTDESGQSAAAIPRPQEEDLFR